MRALLVIAALLIAGYLLVLLGNAEAEGGSICDADDITAEDAALCAGAHSVSAEPVQSASLVSVVSVQCKTNTWQSSADGVIRNISGEAIKFPSVFVKFNDGTVADGHVMPMTLPPGALGTFTVSGPRVPNSVTSCAVFSVQDQSGRSIL